MRLISRRKVGEVVRCFPKSKKMRSRFFKLTVATLFVTTSLMMLSTNDGGNSGITDIQAVPGGDRFRGGFPTRFPPGTIMFPQPKDSRAHAALEKRLPTALIIGVPFGGTKALQEWMIVNPSFVAPPETVGFFSDDSLYFQGKEWYRQQMPPTWPNQTTVERNSFYFVNSKVAKRVYELDRNMKLLLITRDPTKRLVSDYIASLNAYHGNETYPTFEEVVFHPGTTRVNERMAAVDRSIYHKHLRSWLQFFPTKKQIYIVDGDLFLRDPAVVMKGVEKFLGIPNYVNRTFFEYDANRGYFCKKYKNKKKLCLKDKRTRIMPEIKNESLPIIQEFYRKHNKRFFDMIKQWLPYWS